MNIAKIEHDGKTHFNITLEDAQRLQLPEKMVDAAISAELSTTYQAEVDRLGDLIAVSPSRAARYENKRNEAVAYLAAGRPTKIVEGEFVMLTAEAAARGITRSDLADLVLARSAAFDRLMASAEALRVLLRTEINKAEGFAAKQAAAEVLIEPFRAAISAALAG